MSNDTPPTNNATRENVVEMTDRAARAYIAFRRARRAREAGNEKVYGPLHSAAYEAGQTYKACIQELMNTETPDSISREGYYKVRNSVEARVRDRALDILLEERAARGD